MELIKVLESFGLKVENIDNMTDEELQSMIDKHIEEQNEHIKNLEEEKESLSKSNEELNASVEGHKSAEEKLNKELSETKEKLTASEAQRTQITELYKENFIKPIDENKQVDNKIDTFDVLEVIAGYSK